MAKKGYVIIVAALLVLVAGVWYYMSRRMPVPLAVPAVVPLGEQLLEKIQNPIKNAVPTTNPFKKAETNPFINVYKNPFGQ